MKYYQIKSKNLNGVDVSKEITLKEHGLAWHELPKKGIYRIYIGMDESLVENEMGDSDFTEFEVLELPIGADIRDEYSWIDTSKVSSFCGQSKSEWLKQPLPLKIHDIASFYGRENL